MNPTGQEILPGQGPNPYGGGYAVVFLLLMSLTLAAVVLIIFIMRCRSPKMPMQKTQRQLLSRIAGFLLGCLIVGMTAFLIDVLTTELEFSSRIEVSDDGTVSTGGTERSEGWYRIGRLVYYSSMLGYHRRNELFSIQIELTAIEPRSETPPVLHVKLSGTQISESNIRVDRPRVAM